MDASKYELFLEQMESFQEALKKNYQSKVWFPRLRGSIEKNTPGNWFFPFVPMSWGHWKEAVYGVHFDFSYARPCGSRPERIRLTIGVEKPVNDSNRQAFKEEIIRKVQMNKIPLSGFVLHAQRHKKLMESEYIQFDKHSWETALHHYGTLQPLVEIIASVLREMYEMNRDAFFDCDVTFS